MDSQRRWGPTTDLAQLKGGLATTPTPPAPAGSFAPYVTVPLKMGQ